MVLVRFVGIRVWLVKFSFFFFVYSSDFWAVLFNEEKCFVCNLDLIVGFGDNLFCDFLIKMEFFFRNNDFLRVELGILIGREEVVRGGTSIKLGVRKYLFRFKWLCDFG